MMLPDPLLSGRWQGVVIVLLVFLALAFAGCTTTSSPVVATPIEAAPVDAGAEADTAVAQADEKPESPTVAEAPAEKKKEAEAEKPAAESATALTAKAKEKMSWSSSESTLREAYELSGRAADLAPKDASVALVHAECAVRYAQTASGLDRPAKISKEAIASMDAAGLSGAALEAKAAYYRASLTGMILQSQGLGAAGKLPELEKMFQRATASPGIEQGGPNRALGMLYLKAPPWPTGIGDLGLAIENLEKAASSYPSFPYNHVCLARAYAEDGMSAEATASLAKAEAAISSGSWGALGSKWTAEIAEIRKKLG